MAHIPPHRGWKRFRVRATSEPAPATPPPVRRRWLVIDPATRTRRGGRSARQLRLNVWWQWIHAARAIRALAESVD